MKYSEQLFGFPVITYARKDIDEADKRKETYNIDDDDDVPYCLLNTKIPIEQITGWGETFIRGISVDEVNEKGAKQTLIFTKTLGEFVCAWSLKRFEAELDKHDKILLDFFDSVMQQEAEKKAAEEYIDKI